MKVAFRDSFLRDVRAIKDPSVLRRIKSIISNVEQVNKPAEIPHLKKLRGEGQYYRIRTGEHRIGLKLEGDLVIFVRALNRKEIYRYFP